MCGTTAPGRELLIKFTDSFGTRADHTLPLLSAAARCTWRAERKEAAEALCASLLHLLTVISQAVSTHANELLCVLQLAGIAVLAIGLWLRFDSQTKSIFEQESNHSSFYTGKRGSWHFRSGASRSADLGTWAWERLAA